MPAKKVKKNPDVDTSFLPDRDRQELERQERDRLRQEWVTLQETMKEEPVQITYSYWDGTGHRFTLTMKKGQSIEKFIGAVIEQLRGDFHELRAITTEQLMCVVQAGCCWVKGVFVGWVCLLTPPALRYIKEDLIIPHYYTFYDFIVTKARGKSGPLFNFDVHDDVRLTNDASVEKDESHAGKVR